MSVRLNGSTSGYTELDAPAVAGNNTLKMPASNGAAYQIVRNGATPGSLELADKIVSGTTQNSTSGTSIDFTGIPSWVKRVTVMFQGVSTSGTSAVIIRLGTSSGFVVTGYVCSVGRIDSAGGTGAFSDTTGFIVAGAGAATCSLTGNLTSTNLTGNSWTESSVVNYLSGAFTAYGAGNVTLSNTLDRIRITTVNGTDTFDAGSINIMYE